MKMQAYYLSLKATDMPSTYRVVNLDANKNLKATSHLKQVLCGLGYEEALKKLTQTSVDELRKAESGYGWSSWA